MAVKYLRKYLTPSAATQTTIYTVPAANTALVSSLRITNPGSGSATINVAIFPLGGGTSYQFIEDAPLPVDSTMDAFSGVTAVMEATDVLKVTSSRADTDFYLSYMEVDRN